MKRPSQDQIDLEIAALLAVRPTIPPVSKFGDPHFKAISAQVAVLRHWLSETHIRSRADARLVAIIGRLIQRESVWGEYVTDAALRAYHWREGHSEELPSADWQAMAEILSRPEEPANA